MKLEIDIKNTENINPTPEQLIKYGEIISALIQTGALDGVKAGQAIIHFNHESQFMGIELNYWPWRRKKV